MVDEVGGGVEGVEVGGRVFGVAGGVPDALAEAIPPLSLGRLRIPVVRRPADAGRERTAEPSSG
ncbi:hypothetical protein ACFY9A_08210 [Streptomyces rubradiris]|uniref:hypothetical protein n=1 Tax=Streptomyces rubradiris TaxID=285531 RepID=UPI0036E018B0